MEESEKSIIASDRRGERNKRQKSLPIPSDTLAGVGARPPCACTRAETARSCEINRNTSSRSQRTLLFPGSSPLRQRDAAHHAAHKHTPPTHTRTHTFTCRRRNGAIFPPQFVLSLSPLERTRRGIIAFPRCIRFAMPNLFAIGSMDRDDKTNEANESQNKCSI